MSDQFCDFWSIFDEVGRVEIPLLQRDYAQGRAGEAEIRRRFVDALAAALATEDARAIHLDFVYGREIDGDGDAAPGEAHATKLEPLDGQQRLTTLFLLHWYAAAAAGRIADCQEKLCDLHGESRFGYRTRPAARALFDALVREEGPTPGELARDGHRPSAWLQDRPWFAFGWLRDPTVMGALTMLDALHERLKANPEAWRRLTERTPRPIRFQLLALERLGLGDDLYLKMNARGKALTPFEVWKAQIERWISGPVTADLPRRSDGRSWHDHVSRSFDGAWLRFLWGRVPGAQPSGVDDHFVHLLRAAALVSRVAIEGPDLAAQVEALRNECEPTFLRLVDLKCVDSNFVQTFTTLLDRLTERGSPTFLESTGHLDESALFERVLLAKGERETDGLTLVDWVQFHAWCKFHLVVPPSLGADEARRALHDWTRVVCNLAVNSDVDDIERLVAALRGVERAAHHAADPELLAHIAAGVVDFEGFNRAQRDEERLKAGLIVRDERWRALLEKAERHAYFRGDIGFLLRFAGIWERWETTKSCAWSDADDQKLRDGLSTWYRKAAAVFLPTPPVTGDFQWERALLATGDYLLKRGMNWSVLTPNDRDASWKRLLRADTRVDDAEARREVARRVLERIDPNDVSASLQSLIDEGVQSAEGPDDWRKLLVGDPRHLAYCGKRNLRWPDNFGRVFLLQRERLSATYTDLHLHDLWLRLKDCLDLDAWQPPERPEIAGEGDPGLSLEATTTGVTLTVVKPADRLELTLTIPEKTDRPPPVDEGWEAGEAGTYRRSSASVTEALDAIVNLTTRLRAPADTGSG